MLDTKVCKECSQTKSLDEFYIDKRNGRPRVYCKSCWQSHSKRWCTNNTEKNKAYKLKWKLMNPEKDKEKSRRWYANNKKVHLARVRKRQMALRQRIPKYGQDGIEQFYKNCPKGYEVDHRIPLQGKYVSGLHVIYNLQYLPQHENRVKSNGY